MIIVEVYRRPTPSGYAEVERMRAGDVLRPVELPQVAIAVADLPWS